MNETRTLVEQILADYKPRTANELSQKLKEVYDLRVTADSVNLACVKYTLPLRKRGASDLREFGFDTVNKTFFKKKKSVPEYKEDISLILTHTIDQLQNLATATLETPVNGTEIKAIDEIENVRNAITSLKEDLLASDEK